MRAAVCGLAMLASSTAAAQAPVNSEGVPPQIIPRFLERGAPVFTTVPSPSGASSIPAEGSPNIPPSTQGGSSDAMIAMLATGYADSALAAAEQAGINAESLAGIGQVESNFRNVPAANGSSSASGP